MCLSETPRQDSIPERNQLDFAGRILDNVHGFIYYTKAEEKIINHLLFKRLQSIKQLSIANWVFPGSEHTRFIHSLGVMYVADKIACQLKLSTNDRKIVRLAGLLHDIGHYPLSHVCEFPYKMNPAAFPTDDYCKNVNARVKEKVDHFSDAATWRFMKRSNGCHHEQIGADIIQNNQYIRDIIVKECGEEAVSIIADMIVGNVERQTTNPLFVQILHSEIDADGIDYLMRDATFSGTSFGTFEIDQLIGCMEKGEYDCNGEKKAILCITPKGIAAADQYIINKFFSYSQVVFNKHLSVTEWMAEQIVDWMQKTASYFPAKDDLKKWVSAAETEERYIDFTDNYFWASLQNLLDNPIKKTIPDSIRYFCNQLLRHNELPFEEGTEVRMVATSKAEVLDSIKESEIYRNLENWNDKIAIFSERAMTKEAPEKEFEDAVYKQITADTGEEGISKEDMPILKAQRLMEGVCVKEDEQLHLLCDDQRSLMRSLYKTRLVILCAFSCDLDGVK